MPYQPRYTGPYLRNGQFKRSTRRYKGKAMLAKFVRRNVFNNNVHHFKFKAYTQNWLGIEMDGNNSYFSRDFSLEDMPSATELVALFDLYRINKIVFKATPRYTSNLIYNVAPFTSNVIAEAGNTDAGGTNLLGTSNMGLPQLITVIDYDDVTTPTSLDELYEYSNVKKTLGSRSHTRVFVPRIKVDPTVTDLSMSKRWISTSNSALNHFGLKGVCANIPDLPAQGGDRPIFFVDLEITMYLSFRNTK